MKTSSKVWTLWFYLLIYEIHTVLNHVYVDGRNSVKRDLKNGIAYANFVAHRFNYLNITRLSWSRVHGPRECGKACVETVTCVSFNLGVFLDQNRNVICELLSSDKFNNSGRFGESVIFHHFSIKSPCSKDPCTNSGTCLAMYEADSYKCVCSPGYSGDKCQIDINECASNPCLNGGTCSDRVNGYVCQCIPGYTGDKCRTDIDECSSNPCQNGGTCSDSINSYICSCIPGYSGIHCETDIDECGSSPCLNGGSCVDRVNAFDCSCLPLVTGRQCEIIGVQDPVALYPLNTAYNARDMTGNQADGIPANVLSAVGPDGKAGGSYQIQGTSSSYITLPNNGGLDTERSITILMWLYAEGSVGPIFLYRPSGDWAVHLFLVNPNNLFARFVGRTGYFANAIVSPESMNLNEWYYVGTSYEYNTGVARLWIDGNVVEQLNVGIFTLATQYDVRLGVKSDDSRYFRGRIARVQVYSTALTEDEIKAVKYRGKS